MKYLLFRGTLNVGKIIIVGSIVAGVIDRIKQKKAERKSVEKGKEIHKPYGIYEKFLKRSLDFGLSILALIVLSPVMVITAILIKKKMGSPVLFMQERPGKDEQIFKILKFRTMSERKDNNGELLPDIERVGKLGKFLRETSLDELPELINIVKGDMSFIGPRPLLIQYVSYYTEQEKHRHDVRPGLSGLAQIHGRNTLSWDERLVCDLKYVRHITFKTDLIIMLKTIQKVLKKEDIILSGTDESILDFDVERKMKRGKML